LLDLTGFLNKARETQAKSGEGPTLLVEKLAAASDRKKASELIEDSTPLPTGKRPRN